MISRRRWILSWLVPALGALFAIAALFWLYRGLDFCRFVSALESANSYWLVVLAGTILLEQLIRGWKWRQILFDLKPISSFRLFVVVGIVNEHGNKTFVELNTVAY